jgi:hypothetical protein
MLPSSQSAEFDAIVSIAHFDESLPPVFCSNPTGGVQSLMTQ